MKPCDEQYLRMSSYGSRKTYGSHMQPALSESTPKGVKTSAYVLNDLFSWIGKS